MTTTEREIVPRAPACAPIPTAAGLLALVEPLGPTVEGGALVFGRDPPAVLLPLLDVLHTGVRAALTGRRWYGCGATRKTMAPRPLDPSAPIPPGITLLAVEGDDRWDRIHAAAPLDLPRVFGRPEALPDTSTAGVAARPAV